jgi:multifunctional 2-oxoglutarate metabolism enzyme
VARKRLIKGANATRVEERIALVPADVGRAPAGQSIFGALRAMEAAAAPPPAAAQPQAVAPKAKTRAPAPKAPADTPPPAAKPAPAKPAAAKRPARPGRLGPSDFSAAERAEIVRCCADYRNRLPTYLLAVQAEVEVIDSVIDKCRKPGTGPT